MERKLPELSEEQWKFMASLWALGETVPIDIIGTLCPLPPGSLLDLLDMCTEQGLIQQHKKRMFSMAPELPDAVRERLIQICNPNWLSEMLDKLEPLDLFAQLPIKTIANLLARSGRDPEAARLNMDLAQESLKKQDEANALEYFHRAINQLVSHLGSIENDSLFVFASLELSNLSIALGKYFTEVPGILERARNASNRLGDRRSGALISLHLGRIYFLGNRYSEAIKCFAAGKAEVKELGDSDILEQAAEFLALFFFMQGKFKDAIDYFEQAVQSFASQAGVKLTNLSAPIWMGLNMAYLGQFHRAIGLLDFHWRHAKRKSHHVLASTIRAILGTVLVLGGNKREGSHHLQMAWKESSESKNFLGVFFSLAGLAYYHFIEGRFQEAWDMGSRLAEETVRGGMLGYFSSPWGLEIAFELERFGYAPIPGFEYRRLADQILRRPNVHLQGIVLRLRAKEAFSQGKSEESVERDLLASKTYLELSGNPIQLAKTRIDLATLKLSQDNREEARTLAQKARQGLSGYWEEFFPDWLRPLLDEEDTPTERRDYQNEIMELLFQMAERTIFHPSLGYCMHFLVSAMNRFFRAERGCLFWSEDGKVQNLTLRAARNLGRDEALSEGFRSNMKLILESFHKKSPILFRSKRALVCLPLDAGNLGCGVLYHDNSYLPDCFDFLNQQMLSRLATQLCSYLEHLLGYIRSMNEKSWSGPGEPVFMEQESDQGILSESPIMAKVLDRADKIALSEATVLIQGETGVGKELLAQRLHKMSLRGKKPFVTIDPSTIPENLLESELFGHEKGAFTGADRRKPGRLELADKGTLFIDEVGEIPRPVQVKLLRVVQEKEFVRIGGRRPITSDFRLLAATNRDLAEEVAKGRFRKDLYYRLNVVTLTLPPLRDRGKDVVMLARHFLAYYSAKDKVPELNLTAENEARLMAYDWPGNVRELKNVMERATILNTIEGLEPHLRGESRLFITHPFADTPSLNEIQRRYIRYILNKTGGKMAGPGGAAKLLGIKRTTLYNRMKKLDMA